MQSKKNKNTNRDLSLQGAKNVTLSVIMAALVLFGNSYLWISSAQEGSEQPASSSGSQGQTNPLFGTTTCKQQITEYGEVEFEKFKLWMEQNFSNKGRTSELIDIARKRYGVFVEMMQSKYNEIFEIEIRNLDADVALQGELFARCQEEVNRFLAMAEDLISIRVESTSAIKKASLYIEKYQQINSKLHGLALNVMKITTSIQSFEQKLPCYLKSCVSN